MRLLVTGGTGGLGRGLIPRSEKAGRQVLVGTRTPTQANHVHFDLSGDPQPLDGVGVLVHLASDSLDADADVEGPAGLWEAAHKAGVRHALYISIVGIDDHLFRYYRSKRAVVAQLEVSGLSYTILLTMQFHGLTPRFVEGIGRRIGMIPVPGGIRVQPIDTDEVARRQAEPVEDGPSGRVGDRRHGRRQTDSTEAEDRANHRSMPTDRVTGRCPGRRSRSFAASRAPHGPCSGRGFPPGAGRRDVDGFVSRLRGGCGPLVGRRRSSESCPPSSPRIGSGGHLPAQRNPAGSGGRGGLRRW